ncbi:hypothetical protein LguiB_007666 [Lonicera macranthoides]
MHIIPIGHKTPRVTGAPFLNPNSSQMGSKERLAYTRVNVNEVSEITSGIHPLRNVLQIINRVQNCSTCFMMIKFNTGTH